MQQRKKKFSPFQSHHQIVPKKVSEIVIKLFLSEKTEKTTKSPNKFDNDTFLYF